MKKKIFLIPAIFILALSSYFVFNSFGTANTTQSPAPYFNVRVLQNASSNPQVGAEVVYKQGETILYTTTTNSNGWVYYSLDTGTYDVYVYYPPRPSDQQSGSLLSHYHNGDENVSISLGPVY